YRHDRMIAVLHVARIGLRQVDVDAERAQRRHGEDGRTGADAAARRLRDERAGVRIAGGDDAVEVGDDVQVVLLRLELLERRGRLQRIGVRLVRVLLRDDAVFPERLVAPVGREPEIGVRLRIPYLLDELRRLEHREHLIGFHAIALVYRDRLQVAGD